MKPADILAAYVLVRVLCFFVRDHFGSYTGCLDQQLLLAASFEGREPEGS